MPLDAPGTLVAFVLVVAAIALAVVAGTAAARVLFSATERSHRRS